MKRILLLLTTGALLACPVHAQDTNTAPPPTEGGGPGGHHHMDFLTEAQKAELKKAHDAAIAADPSLATEEEKIRQNHPEPGTPPTDAQKAEFKAFHEKLDAAMIKADPAVAPILEEMKKHHHHGHDGPPPPAADSGT